MLSRIFYAVILTWTAVSGQDQYERSLQVPVGNGIFEVKWNVTTTDINFEFAAPTTGWIGLGFGSRISPNLDDVESFKNADIYIAWLRTANPPEQHFYDSNIQQYIQNQGFLVAKDTIPNVDRSDVRTEQRNGITYTVARFQRKLSTCDLLQDYAINGSTISLILAFGTVTPSSALEPVPVFLNLQQPRGHTVQPYLLLDRKFGRIPSTTTTTNPDALQPWRLPIPAIQPGLDTLWPTNTNVNNLASTLQNACQFSSADLPENQQSIVQVKAQADPRIQSIKLYMCAKNITAAQLQGKSIQPNRFVDNCVPEGIYADIIKNCREMIASWSNIGSNVPNSFPDDTGYTMSREEYAGRFRMLQVTYTPSGITPIGAVQNELQLDLSKRTVSKNIGLLSVSADNGEKLLIPGQSREFLVRAFCDIQCSRKHIPGGGITLTSVQHTTNSYGIQMRTRLIRDGKEVKVISEDFAHTSAFQPFRDIDHVQILPGDRILLECTYNTSRVLSDTTGGYGSNNEACSAIFSYYPRIAGFQFCGSTPELRHIQALRNVARAGTNTGSVPMLSRSESALLQQYPTPSNTADNAPYGSLAMGTYGPNTVPVLDRNVAAPVSSNPDQCAQSRAQNLYLYHRHEPVCELETPELFRVDSIDMLPVLSDPQCPNVMIQRNISYVWPLECYDIIFRDEVQNKEICRNVTVTQTGASERNLSQTPTILLAIVSILYKCVRLIAS